MKNGTQGINHNLVFTYFSWSSRLGRKRGVDRRKRAASFEWVLYGRAHQLRIRDQLSRLKIRKNIYRWVSLIFVERWKLFTNHTPKKEFGDTRRKLLLFKTLIDFLGSLYNHVATSKLILKIKHIGGILTQSAQASNKKTANAQVRHLFLIYWGWL